MTPSGRTPDPPGPGPGLVLRIWVGCLGSAIAVAAALWFVVARQPAVTAPLDSELVWVWLPAIAGGGVLIGILLAAWLTRGIARPLRGLTRGAATGQVAELRGLPSSAGWGEVSALGLQLQRFLGRQAQLARAGAELDLLRQQIERMREPLERWARTGRAETIEPEIGPLRSIALTLQRGMARAETERAVMGSAAEALASQRPHALNDARETAEQAERAFVEATALLTTVRELQRLSAELQANLAAGAGGPESGAGAYERYRAAAAEAIEELVNASTASVGHLARGMERVAEVSEQVQVVANRATLIALNAVAAVRGSATGGAGEGDVAGEFKTLAREVRAATDRAAALAREIEADVVEARERMQGVRGRVAEVLDRVPPPGDATAANEGATRLLARVREMVQDATIKGERLSAAGERSSRAAETLMRRLEEEALEIDRLAAAAGRDRAAAATQPAVPDPSASGPPPGPGQSLRLLGREDLEDEAGGRRERR
jgi:methyl-accepting chemotaxis protein